MNKHFKANTNFDDPGLLRQMQSQTQQDFERLEQAEV
jgi:hypothetical protein